MPDSDTSSIGSSVGRVEACWIGCKQRWSDFVTFLWDPTNKTVLGRGGKSWGRILIFYLFYYGFLAALFAISITIVLSSLDPYTPYFQTRLQSPGVNIQPRQRSRIALTSDIKFNPDDSSTYQKYTQQMETFLYAYGLANQSDPAIFKNCTNGKVMTGQQFTNDEQAKSCVFDKNLLGPCAVPPYGYDKGQPCILVKLNRIINWFPVGYTDISNVEGNSYSKAPKLTDVLEANNALYDPYKVFVSCYSTKSDQYVILNGVNQQVSSNTKYYPRDGGIPFMYFPYYGMKRQPSYVTPVVAVQFTNVTRGTLINMACKAYARNIPDDLRLRVGYFNFEMELSN